MIKLLIGGSPCTHWSIAQTKNRETEPSGIGWELFENYLIALDKFKPDFFLYENNKSMSKAIREEITRRFGFEPICINSALVSAQNRQRLYWCGKRNHDGTYSRVDVQQPEDRGILLRDVLETGISFTEKGYTLKAQYYKNSAVNAVDGGYYPAPMVAESVEMAITSLPSWRRKKIEQHKRDHAEAYCLRYERSEEAKRLRKAYESGEIKHGYHEFHELHPRLDGKTNTITTVQKDNMIIEPVRVGTIDSDAWNQTEHDSKQYRVYSPDGKSVTLCGQGGGVGAKTGLYAVPTNCDVVITENNIRCQRRDKKHSTLQGSHVSFDDRKSQTMSPSHVPRVIETARCKTTQVYEVQNGLITIKGKQYPIKLSDGFYIIRKLTVTECKRLQTVPDSYIFPVSDTQAYKMLGNGWTVDVIVHILSYCQSITDEPLDVLSMYDGMACGHIALDKMGAQIARYRATEIDKYAIKTACHNFPDIIQLGDAFQVREWK